MVKFIVSLKKMRFYYSMYQGTWDPMMGRLGSTPRPPTNAKTVLKTEMKVSM